ncbi:MAG: Gfo/Idh/MocA family oxidoreductase [Pseudomonadota bacterium]
MKVAMIGTGMVADTHALACRDSRDVELIGVCARSFASAAAYAERLDAEHGMRVGVYENVAEVAGDADVDFVLLITPPDARMGPVATLADAGKPILMEKPVERSFIAASELVALCAGRVPLGIVFQHHMREASLALAAQLPRLGAVQTVEISVPWWRDQAYYDAPGRGSYARDGGGVMINQAIHTLDLALTFTGPVRAVQAFARTSKAHEMEAEDFVCAGLEFESGAVGSLTASTASFPGRAEMIRLHCEKASAVLGEGVLEVTWRDGASERFGARGGPGGGAGGGADPMAFTHAWHQAVIEDFAGALRKGRDPLVTGRAALQVHALIEALTRSSHEGRMVEVPHV